MRAVLVICFLAAACGGSQGTRYRVNTASDAEQARFVRAVEASEDSDPPRWCLDGAATGPRDPVNTPIIRVATLPTNAQDVRITGRVVTSTSDQPMADVTVVLEHPSGHRITAVSNIHGRIRATTRRHGHYRVSAHYGDRSVHAQASVGAGTAVFIEVVMPAHPSSVYLLSCSGPSRPTSSL